MNKKHKHAIKRLEGIAVNFRNAIKQFSVDALVPIWKENLEDVERAIRILKADREKTE